MDVCIGWLAALLHLDRSRESPCCRPRTAKKMLLIRRSTEAQTEPGNLAFTDEESPEYFCTVTNEMSAHFNITPGSHLYKHSSGARKELPSEAFVVEKV